MKLICTQAHTLVSALQTNDAQQYVCVYTSTFVDDVVKDDHVEGLQLSRQAHRIGASELHGTGPLPFLHTPTDTQVKSSTCSVAIILHDYMHTYLGILQIHDFD